MQPTKEQIIQRLELVKKTYESETSLIYEYTTQADVLFTSFEEHIKNNYGKFIEVTRGNIKPSLELKIGSRKLVMHLYDYSASTRRVCEILIKCSEKSNPYDTDYNERHNWLSTPFYTYSNDKEFVANTRDTEKVVLNTATLDSMIYEWIGKK